MSPVRQPGRVRGRDANGSDRSRGVLWAPRRAAWWTAALFMVGSACFVVAPIPAYLRWVGASADGATFFVGSVFFTSAAALQWRTAIRTEPTATTTPPRWNRLGAGEDHDLDWWSSGVQLLGTLFFNATTWRALTTAVASTSYDRVVWRPDAYGSVCFLVSGYLAYLHVTGGPFRRPPRSREGAVASVNLFGCVAFGLAALAGYVLPASGELLSLPVTNAATCVGALAFLLGAALLLPQATEASTGHREG